MIEVSRRIPVNEPGQPKLVRADVWQGLVMKANNGKRKVPTLEVDGRYFACSPFDAQQLATELNVSLNPSAKL